VSAAEAKVAEIAGSGRRVLHAGSDAGSVATALREAGNEVVSVDPAELEREAKRAREAYDAVVFAGALESVADPARALTACRRLLREGGVVVAALRNVAHGAVRLALLHGRFDYRQLGIDDGPPVRFYTRESALRLFTQSGLAVQRVERTTAPVFGDSPLVPRVRRNDFDPALVAEVLRDEDAETLQFVIAAEPLAEAEALELLRAEVARLERALETPRAERGVEVDPAHAASERLAELELLRAERDALAERVKMLDDLLAVERATRLDVEDACERIERVARSRFEAAHEDELARLRTRSGAVELELKLARLAARRVESPARRPPARSPLSADAVRGVLAGRRTLDVLPAPAASASPLRSRLRRLRRAVPFLR